MTVTTSVKRMDALDAIFTYVVMYAQHMVQCVPAAKKHSHLPMVGKKLAALQREIAKFLVC